MAQLFLAARAAAVPAIPPLVHSAEQVSAWVTDWDLTDHELWLAEAGAEEDEAGLLGFVLVTATWIDHLYVAPYAQGRGTGTALLQLVQALRPDGVGLWVFESNHAARRFYARHGFVEVARTDGSENEERAPDIHLSWPGAPH